MPNDLATLVPWLIALPAVGAVACAALGPRRGDAVRAVALATTLLLLVLTALVSYQFAAGVPEQPDLDSRTFAPRMETVVDLLPLGQVGGQAAAIRFHTGLDGLNVWLVALTAVLMVPSVLVSWTAVTERVNEYYAWLLALAAAMLGVFLSFDILLFYVFFELTLVPLFFLIGIWGGSQRQHAARKFFVYTLTGSLITLVGVLAVVLACYFRADELTFSIPRLVDIVQERLRLATGDEVAYWRSLQIFVFLAMMVGFAVKVPIVPFHTWLPLAHVEAPTAGSVLLAGVLLKLGSYGILRLAVPLAPDAALTIGTPLVGTLAVVGIIYGAFCALAQDDIKKLVAYSSVSHLGMCMLGLFALNATGLSGSLIQMVNHGLSTGGLFLLVGMLYERYHTRRMADYGGMAARLRLLGTAMVFVCLSSAGLPMLNGFWGEALSLMGMAQPVNREVNGWLLTALGATGVVLGAWYLWTMLRRVFFGPVKEPGHEGHAAPAAAHGGHGGHGGHGHDDHGSHAAATSGVRDLCGRELWALAPIVVLCVALGVYPQPFFRTTERDVRVVANIVADARARTEVRLPVPEAAEAPHDTDLQQARAAGETTP